MWKGSRFLLAWKNWGNDSSTKSPAKATLPTPPTTEFLPSPQRSGRHCFQGDENMLLGSQAVSLRLMLVKISRPAATGFSSLEAAWAIGGSSTAWTCSTTLAFVWDNCRFTGEWDRDLEGDNFALLIPRVSATHNRLALADRDERMSAYLFSFSFEMALVFSLSSFSSSALFIGRESTVSSIQQANNKHPRNKRPSANSVACTAVPVWNSITTSGRVKEGVATIPAGATLPIVATPKIITEVTFPSSNKRPPVTSVPIASAPRTHEQVLVIESCDTTEHFSRE